NFNPFCKAGGNFMFDIEAEKSCLNSICPAVSLTITALFENEEVRSNKLKMCFGGLVTITTPSASLPPLHGGEHFYLYQDSIPLLGGVPAGRGGCTELFEK
ncbi:MAG: hypothetical protein LBM13_03700, partial [Candidatus Ancillula sp.]|nr:hypothetical protein [Candidatus Ancillula sp.]